MLSHTLLALTLAPLAVLGHNFTIRNSCPEQIALYTSTFWGSDPEPRGTVAAGGTVRWSFEPSWSGLIYTDANGGNRTGDGATRAGFSGQNDLYYIIRDPAKFNTGITISTDQPQRMGWCVMAFCETPSCATAFLPPPPTRFPVPGSLPPDPPFYSCGFDTTSYSVTFCPSGRFPNADDRAVTIHPNGNPGKCLDVRGAVYENGTPAQIYDCNGTGAQKWVVNKGRTKVRLAGTNFCLDAGSAPANGIKGKIWQCYDDLPAQDWWYTDDNRIALTDRGLCLDLTDGILTNSNQVQTWQCMNGNTNQIWTV